MSTMPGLNEGIKIIMKTISNSQHSRQQIIRCGGKNLYLGGRESWARIPALLLIYLLCSLGKFLNLSEFLFSHFKNKSINTYLTKLLGELMRYLKNHIMQFLSPKRNSIKVSFLSPLICSKQPPQSQTELYILPIHMDFFLRVQSCVLSFPLK